MRSRLRAALGSLIFLVLVPEVVAARGYEEPTLAKRYGEQYVAYRRSVPGWWPRRRPVGAGGLTCRSLR